MNTALNHQPKYVVTSIHVYPVKGLKGVPVDSAKCTQRGFQHDRMWMIIDNSNNFISQRTDPTMALISTELKTDGILLSYNGKQTKLPLLLDSGNEVQATVWDDTCIGIEASADQNNWISEILLKPCRFIFMSPNHKRYVDSRYAKNNESVSFADGFPYLIIGNSSLHLLNSKLDAPVTMDRFRPNIVFDGGEPHDEDTWREFTIGDVSFYGEKPCARCKVTTIDQQTGKQGKEPLQTLAKYRQTGNKIMFGLNILAKGDGYVKVGDQIVINEKVNISK